MDTTICNFNNCNSKSIKHYNHCIKHLKHEIPPKVDKPKDCQVCKSSCEHIDLTQYCCGHWMHESCLIHSGKARCPICNKLVHVSASVLKQIKKITQEQQELAAYPLLITYEIDIQVDDAVKFKYTTNKNFKHEKLHVMEMVKLLKKQLIDNLFILDIALLMNTRKDEHPDFDERSDHVDNVCRDTIDKIMQHILSVLPTSKYRYIPVKIIPSVRVYTQPTQMKMVRTISFYCNFRDKYTVATTATDDTKTENK